MSLVIYNGSDGLIDKLGQWFGVQRELTDNRTAIISRIDNAYDTYANDEQYQTAPMDAIYTQLTSAGTDPAVMAAYATCVRTLVEFVNTAIPLPAKTVAAALQVLVEQMILQSATVAESTVGGSAAYQGTPIGDGSMLFPDLGQNVYGQIITAKCIQDSLTGTQEGMEVFQVSTPQAVRQSFSTIWGTGTGISIRATPLYYLGGPAQGPNQTLLANGSFDSFTVNAPDSWTIVTGAATISSQAVAVQGTNSMIWTGDGATFQDLRQNLNGTVGASLLPSTSYIGGIWLRRGAVAPTGGVTKFQVIGSSGTLLSIDVPDASLTDEWQLFSDSFTTTQVLPTGVYCKVVHDTGAIQSTRTIQLSCGFVAEPISFGVGRAKATLAQFLLYSGPEPFRNDDTILGTISNNRGGEVQTWFDRNFGTAALGIVLPSSGSPTIPDSVIPT